MTKSVNHEDIARKWKLDYLSAIREQTNRTLEGTNFAIGADYPMKVVWNTDSFDYEVKLKKKGVSYTFLLAPRIETNDDYQPSKPATEAEPSEAEDADEEEDTDFEECEVGEEAEA